MPLWLDYAKAVALGLSSGVVVYVLMSQDRRTWRRWTVAAATGVLALTSCLAYCLDLLA